MTDVKARIGRLYRRLQPAGLTREWVVFLAVLNDVCGRLGVDTMSETEIREVARQAAATGQEPGEALAQTLLDNAPGA